MHQWVENSTVSETRPKRLLLMFLQLKKVRLSRKIRGNCNGFWTEECFDELSLDYHYLLELNSDAWAGIDSIPIRFL
jgi:hypothetical protein